MPFGYIDNAWTAWSYGTLKEYHVSLHKAYTNYLFALTGNMYWKVSKSNSLTKWIVTPYYWCVGAVKNRHNFQGWNMYIAVSKDCYGNVLLQHWLNGVFGIGYGYKFGNWKETISSVLGKKYAEKTLSKFGILLHDFLNVLDKNHCEKYMNNNI